MPPSTRDKHSNLEPVPVAVLLPTPPTGSRRPQPAGKPLDQYGLTGATATALLASYTKVGQLVADLHGSPSVRAAADWLDRRYTTMATQPRQTPLAALIIGLLPEASGLHQMTERVRALRRGLLPGGHLVIAVPATLPTRWQGTDGIGIDPATDVIAAARTASLTYQQHLVAVQERVPEPSPGHRVTALATNRHPVTHSHLLVFRHGEIPAVEGGADG